MTGEEQIRQLVERLDWDSEYATVLESDPFAALRDEGFDELVVSMEQERERIEGLVDRIYDDDEFRRAIEEDPSSTLHEWGLPDEAIAPLLMVAGAPDAVIERATADVEAHLFGKKPATMAAVTAVLGTLAFAQQATAGSKPATRAQVSRPAVSAEVTRPGSRAEIIRPGARAQLIRAGAKAEISRPALAGWLGIGVQRANMQHTLTLALRAQSSTR